MIALEILTVLFLQTTLIARSQPPPPDDTPCSDDQNNCPNNSYCYIYSETGLPYCAESCELNNGGCGTDQCEMVNIQCITAPCPPVVQCITTSGSITATTSSSEFRSRSSSITPTRSSRSSPSRSRSRSRSRPPRTQTRSGSRSRSPSVSPTSVSGSVISTRPSRSGSRSRSPSVLPTSVSGSVLSTRPHPSQSGSRSRSPSASPTSVSGSVISTHPSRSGSRSRSPSISPTSVSGSVISTRPSRSGSRSRSPSVSPTSVSGSILPTHSSRTVSGSRSRSVSQTRTSISRSVTRTTSTYSTLPSPSTTPAGPYTCSLQPDSGTCAVYHNLNYFYNVTSGMCQTILYSGCGGNDNRFSTYDECYNTCSKAVNICEFYPESGICEAYIPSYFYNVTSKRCDKFIYGGCGGNANRFSSLDQCQATCNIDVCNLQPETGHCRGSFPRYYYNKFTRRCELFIYGGCGGNGNRFNDVETCEKACILLEPTTTPTPGAPKENIVIITIGPYDGDLDDLIAEFTSELKKILFENGIYDISIKIVNMSYTPDNGVQLSVVVYSGNSMISGDKIATLITENKDTFTVAVSNAIAGDKTMASSSESSDDNDNLSGGAIAGIVVGIIVGLIFAVLLAIVILYFIKTRQETTEQLISKEKSDGLDNPIYSDNQAE